MDSPSSVLVWRAVVELPNYTKWELCDYLLNMDWSVKPMPSKKQRRVLPLETAGPVVKDEGNIIFARKNFKDLSRWYLLTLASLESLRAQGITEVKHGEKESYYKQFFGVGSGAAGQEAAACQPCRHG